MNLPRSVSALTQLIASNVRSAALNKIHKSSIHLDSTLRVYEKRTGPKIWPALNDKIYPPQTQNEEPRPAVNDFGAFVIDYLIDIIRFGFSLFVI